MTTILDRRATAGQASPIGVRPEPGPPPPTLAEILADPRFSDPAKLLAEYLDGRCRAPGRWAAWPKVSTIAAHLGWDATAYGGRKKAERAFRELGEAGLLGRIRLGDLVEWFDSEGAARGLDWPRELPRNLKRGAKICILGWKMPGACPGLPILPECDISVASDPPPGPADVASNATPMSHGNATEMSHPSYTNVRTFEPETTTTPRACARAREGLAEPSSSSREVSRGDGGRARERVAACRAATAEVPGPAPPKPLATDDDHDQADDQAGPAEPPDSGPARARLIEAIDRAAPPDSEENRALRRFAGAKVEAIRGESSTPHDHVRRAIEIALAVPKSKLRKTIREHAAGTLANWSREGFPPLEARAASLAGPAPDPKADQAAADERQRARVEANARRAASKARWEGLTDPEKDAFRAIVARDNPGLPGGFLTAACLDALDGLAPGQLAELVAAGDAGGDAGATPCADPPPPAVAPEPDPSPPAPGLTGPQRAFLGALTPGQRAAFDAWPPPSQADTLESVRLGEDVGLILRMLAEQASTIQ